MIARSPATKTSSISNRVSRADASWLHGATQASRPDFRAPLGAGWDIFDHAILGGQPWQRRRIVAKKCLVETANQLRGSALQSAMSCVHKSSK